MSSVDNQPSTTLTPEQSLEFFEMTTEPALLRLVARADNNGGIVTLRSPEINPDLPTVFAVMGPSTVGKTAIASVLAGTGVGILRTASERPKRDAEGVPMENKFPPRLAEESFQAYLDRVNNEVRASFIGIDFIDGYLYGLPVEETKKLETGGAFLLMARPDSIPDVEAALIGQANVVRVGIIPDNFRQLYERIRCERDPSKRMLSLYDLIHLPQMADYLIHNQAAAVGESAESAVRKSATTFRRLIDAIIAS